MAWDSFGGFSVSVAETVAEKLVSHLSICTSALVTQQPPYLSIWQFYLSIAQSSAGKGMQYKRSHRCVLLYPLYTLLVLPHCVSVSICMCWCVRRTDCTPPQCSRWPPRPSAPICVVLLLPSVEVKTQKKNHRTWHCGRSLSQGSDSQAAEMMKMEPAPLSLLLCVCVCVKTLRLHLPGSFCSQLRELHAP